MVTDPRIGEWLADLDGSELTRDPLSVSAVNFREWRRSYRSRDQDLGKACGRDRESYGRRAVSLGKSQTFERLENLRALPGANCFA